MRGHWLIVGLGGVLAALGPAHGAPLTLTYDSYGETKVLSTPLDPSTPIRMDGLLPDRGGSAVRNVLTFKAGSSDLSLSAGWLTAPVDVRTIGVNIDLFDSSNSLVASDSFLGTTGALASSRMIASGLSTGAVYSLVMTGTAVQGGRYQIELADGSTPPPTPAVPVIPTSTGRSTFDTLFDEKNPGGTFAPGDEMQIDGVLTESGAIWNSVVLRVRSDSLSAGIEWLVAPGPQRTIGVNVDLFDATDSLIASDGFVGVTDGQAFSQLSVSGLLPGDYTLRFTGNATDGGRFRINLTTDPTAPGFEPIPTDETPSDVPEPQPMLLLLMGAASLIAVSRSKLAAVSQSKIGRL